YGVLDGTTRTIPERVSPRPGGFGGPETSRPGRRCCGADGQDKGLIHRRRRWTQIKREERRSRGRTSVFLSVSIGAVCGRHFLHMGVFKLRRLYGGGRRP